MRSDFSCGLTPTMADRRHRAGNLRGNVCAHTPPSAELLQTLGTPPLMATALQEKYYSGFGHTRGDQVLESGAQLMNTITTRSTRGKKREERTPSVEGSSHGGRQKRARKAPRLTCLQTTRIPMTVDCAKTRMQQSRLPSTATPACVGKSDIPATWSEGTLQRATFEPIPVRVPPAAVAQLPGRPSSSLEGECLLGLAIASYLQPGHREVVYVVLLDDGHELHIPCGQLERIILPTVDATDDNKEYEKFKRGLHLRGHPSSQDVEDSFNSISDATAAIQQHGRGLGGGSWPASSDLGLDSKEHGVALSDINMSQSEFGGAFDVFRLLQPQLHSLSSTQKRVAIEAIACQRPAAPESSALKSLTGGTSNNNDRSFSDLFEDVVLDHATQRSAVGPSLHETALFNQVLAAKAEEAVQKCVVPQDLLAAEVRSSAKATAVGTAQSIRDLKASSRRHSSSDHRAPTSATVAASATCRVSAVKRIPRVIDKAVAGMSEPPDSRQTSPAPCTRQVYHRRRPTTGAEVSVGGDKCGQTLAESQNASNIAFRGEANASTRHEGVLPPRQRPSTNVPRRASRASAAAEAAAFAAAFAEDTWTSQHSTYVHDPVVFRGPFPGPTFTYRRMPSKMSLFGRFWTEKMLERICKETNRYASEADPETLLPMGGPRWWSLNPMELRAFLGISLMMGIKRLPNHRAYWSKRFPFMYCETIAKTMSQSRYEDITRCLHVSEDAATDEDDTSTSTDTLAKLGWLITELRRRFKQYWHLHQEVTVDECMVRYKGSYCPIRQYIPKKPTKWGIKVWCLADARKSYVYDFSVYTGSVQRSVLAGCGGGGAKSGYDVVMLLMQGLHGLGHVVVTDNFFTSVKLVFDLAALGTYATGTVNSNRIGLPRTLAQKKLFATEPRGCLAWRMHSSRAVSCVVWVDRQPVLLLSSFYTPVPRLGEEWPTVPRWVGGEERQIVTSPVHKGYVKYMRGVDVADQMRGAYSSQVRSHKWWHRLFFFLLDTSVVNTYIIYKSICERFVRKPMERMDFQLLLAESLCKPWMVRRGCVSRFHLAQPAVHCLVRTRSRRKCRFCFSSTRTNLSCVQCGGVHLHMGECFRRTHYSLRR